MEIVSLVIAIIAAAMSGVSLYWQFFHTRRSLRLATGWLPKELRRSEHAGSGISLVYTNCGTVSCVITKFEVSYSIAGTKSNGVFITPDHELLLESERSAIAPGEHLVCHLILSDQFPRSTPSASLVDSSSVRGPDGKPLKIYEFPIYLRIEFLDDRGDLLYAHYKIGEHSFDTNKKHSGFAIPQKSVELYQNS